jgi:ribulose 1,5-bisphosphate synthetase/thiazole synthase
MKTYIEPEKAIPILTEVDVLVAGGGPAGIAAAIAAARAGAKTMIVERYGYLGGMVTGSYVTYYMGFGNGNEQVIYGIAQETIDRLREVGGLTREQDKSGDCYGDAEIIKCISVIMLEEAGVEMLLHTWASSAIVENNVCKGIVVENKSGRQAILAKTVIDATADADICVSAKVETKLDLHDITLCHSIDGIDTEKRHKFERENPELNKKLMEELNASGGKVVFHVPGKSAVNAADLTCVENETRKSLLKKLVFMRKNIPGCENAFINKTAPQLGVRESRKIVGEYTITVEDILNDRKFDDGVGRCGAYMEKYENYDKPGLSYDIPYRSLIPAKVDNLLTAGRCISATHEAINTLRLVVPCILTGEAAGTAAALSAMQDIPPRNLDVKKLQEKLIEQKNNLG